MVFQNLFLPDPEISLKVVIVCKSIIWNSDLPKHVQSCRHSFNEQLFSFNILKDGGYDERNLFSDQNA